MKFEDWLKYKDMETSELPEGVVEEVAELNKSTPGTRPLTINGNEGRYYQLWFNLDYRDGSRS